MGIGQTFPDVVVHDDSEIRLVTHAARRWIYENTNIKDGTDISGPDSVPRLVTVSPDTCLKMEEDGLVIRWPKTGPWAYHERIPEWRRKYAKWEGD